MVPSKLRAALQDARSENAALRAQIAGLERENAGLRRRLETLEGRLTELHRAEKRQAAPFSKGEPKADPKVPGRRAGAGYGRKGHRLPPSPDHVNQSVRAALPEQCPGCGGTIERHGVAEQFQEELPPPAPVVTRFLVAVGRCRGCGRRVQGRHPQQTSDALGAARAQLGPRAHAAAGWLMKRMGLSAGKAAAVLAELAGLTVTPGGLVQATQRLGWGTGASPRTSSFGGRSSRAPRSVAMRPAGGSGAIAPGCGPSSPPTRPATRSPRVAAAT